MTTTTLEEDVAKPVVMEPEDFLHLSDSIAYELVDGKLVERHMGAESSLIAAQIIFLLKSFFRGKHLGHVFGSDATLQCFPGNPKKMRRADVSVICYGRLPGEQIPKGQLKIAPDLVVEVISPGDTAEEVEQKVDEYISAGVRLIWVVYPVQRKMFVRRPIGAQLGPLNEFNLTDSISGEDVLPGFAATVKELFAME